MRLYNAYHAVFLLAASLLIACSGEQKSKNEVVIHEYSDPETLNPINLTDASAAFISHYIFPRLIDVDFRHPTEFVPVLAESMPLIETREDGKMTLTFQIRKEAKWDNGSPVTAADVAFTLKTYKCPLVDNPNSKSFFNFVNDIEFYDDPRRISIISNTTYFLAEAIFVDIVILPEYFYDQKGLMKNISISMIDRQPDSVSKIANVIEYAEDFNSDKRRRDPNYISGAGPYKFISWQPNEQVVLEKKSDWWGKKFENENCHFEAYPEKLIFRPVNDPATARVALKAGHLDLMRGIKPKDFLELKESQKFLDQFNYHNIADFSYMHIGFNSTNQILKDKSVRQALSYITDVDGIIKTIMYGNAERVVGPIHPSKKNYHKDLELYAFNPEKAAALLAEAGWANSDNNETLDKMIDGKKVELELNLIVNSGNEERKGIALIFQEQAKKIGVKINVQTLDWAVYLERCQKHDYEIMVGKWITSQFPDQLIQNFHSRSALGQGSNFYNFSNAEADSLMDALETIIDENKRNKIYFRVQEILHEEAPMVFLYAPVSHLAINKKFENAYPSTSHPGYWAPGFKLIASAEK